MGKMTMPGHPVNNKLRSKSEKWDKNQYNNGQISIKIIDLYVQ